MRKGNDCDFIRNEDGQVIGLNLGADYCSEHEWGIDGIKTSFGMVVNEKEKPFASWWKGLLGLDKPVMGVEKRSITKCSENLLKGEGVVKWKDYQAKPKSKEHKADVYYIGFKPHHYSSNDPHDYYKKNLQQIWDGSKQVWGWWAESDFMVASTNKEIIDQLFQAFQDKDIVIMLGGGGPFQNAGLCIIQKSKISEANKKLLFDGDNDSWELKKVAVKTGIYERLEKANKKFYALSPSWNKEKTEVRFWLNPEEQGKYNACWCTVKELDQWINNEGPIIKTKETIKK